MELLLMLILFIYTFSLLPASCPDNEEPQFCQSRSFIPQSYCDGVVELQEKWTCKKRSDGRCSCKSPLYRNMDGKCVEKHKCDEWKRGAPEPEPLPKPAQGAPVNNETVLTFLRHDDPLYLQMMSEHEYVNNSCLCVKSVLLAKYDRGCERTLECYTYAKTLIAPTTSKAIIGQDKMILKKENADFQVITMGSTVKIYIWIILGIMPANIRPSALAQSYIVHVAKENCLLVTYGGSDNDERHCLLWGLSRHQVDKESECYKQHASVCSGEMSDMTERADSDPCYQFDRHEQRIQEKIRKEQESQFQDGA